MRPMVSIVNEFNYLLHLLMRDITFSAFLTPLILITYNICIASILEVYIGAIVINNVNNKRTNGCNTFTEEIQIKNQNELYKILEQYRHMIV